MSPSPPHYWCTCNNRNFCHKTISNLHYEYKHTQTKTMWNTASIVLVIVQSNSRSDKAVCSARHEAMQEDRPNTILQTQNSVESISITAVLSLSPLPCSCLLESTFYETLRLQVRRNSTPSSTRVDRFAIVKRWYEEWAGTLLAEWRI